MAAKTKKKSTKKSTDMLNVNGKDMKLDAYRDQLLAELKKNRDDVKKCKRIRHNLRTKCKHFGGLRNRTYVDQTTGTKVNVDKAPATAKAKAK